MANQKRTMEGPVYVIQGTVHHHHRRYLLRRRSGEHLAKAQLKLRDLASIPDPDSMHVTYPSVVYSRAL